MIKVLVTGSAGFIGANLVLRLLETESPIEIVGLDSVNDYYDFGLKKNRLTLIKQSALVGKRVGAVCKMVSKSL